MKKFEEGIFAEIRWHVEDLKEVLAQKGYAVSDHNIEKVLNSRLARTLEEISIQYGWEILMAGIDDVEDLHSAFDKEGVFQVNVLVNGYLYRSCFSPEEVKEAEQEIIVTCSDPKHTEVCLMDLDYEGRLVDQCICSVLHLMDDYK